jgi:mRNA-degrading endonuclease toxin of MazEF toxin-antitoxin module
VARSRGEVYWYDYGEEIKTRPCLIVSINTKSDTVMGVDITNTPFDAPYVVPVAGMNCSTRISGYIRCDHVSTMYVSDRYWQAFVLSLDDEDMQKVEVGLRAALGL